MYEWYPEHACSAARGRYNGTDKSKAMCALPFYHYRGRGTELRKHGTKGNGGGGDDVGNKDEEEEEEELEVRSSKLHSDLAYVQLHPEVRYSSINHKLKLIFFHILLT